MKKLIVLLAVAVTGWVPSSFAVPVFAGDVPAANYITQGALDWVWASPCEGDGSGCAEAVTLHDGWRFPTTFEYDNLLAPAEAALISGSICGSGWFQGNFTHCDFGDVIWRNDDPSTDGDFGDTLLVRGAAAPEPGALALLGIGLLGFGVSRRMKVA